MARRLKKRKRPKPSPVTIRRVGESAEVVSASAMARRTEEAEWVHAAQGVSIDLWREQCLLGLNRNDTITVPEYTDEVWWFVQDVDGPAKEITATTLLFARPLELTFPFRMVEPHPLGRAEAAEAFAALAALDRQRRVSD